MNFSPEKENIKYCEICEKKIHREKRSSDMAFYISRFCSVECRKKNTRDLVRTLFE